MTFEQSFMALLAITSGVLGWFGRELWSEVQKLRTDLYALEVRIGNDYIRYDRLQDTLKPILSKLDRIEELPSQKADK